MSADANAQARAIADGRARTTTSSVPALDRAVGIFDLLSERPLDRLTLSEISRATGIHKATCSSMLATMVGHGLVHRDDDRRYAIGSRFVKLGYAYTQRCAPYTAGRRDVMELVARSGLSCAVIAREDDELVILDILGNSEPAHLYMRIGDRVPLVPPVGTIFKAWAPVAELDEWLEQMVREFGGDRVSYEAAIATLRARGVSLGGEHDFGMELQAALQRAERRGEDTRVLEVALIVADKIRNYNEDEGDEAEPLNSVIAPIFDGDASVAATLNLFGEFGTVRMSDLPDLVPRLRSTAAQITQKSGGRIPRGFPVG